MILASGAEAVLLADAIEFEVEEFSSIVLTADYLGREEIAMVYRKGISGDYVPLTDKNGPVFLSDFPNCVVLDIPNFYKVTKTVSSEDAVIGY